jgi:hypothetical protein
MTCGAAVPFGSLLSVATIALEHMPPARKAVFE